MNLTLRYPSALPNVKKIQLLLFYTILAILPINLGYHFIFKWNYVNGLLTDYLIPVIYVQDILVFILVTFSLPKLLKSLFSTQNIFVIWFLFALLLSAFSSVLPQASWHMFLRTLLYFLFMLYVKQNIRFEYDSLKIFKTFAYSIIFLSVLGIAQWLHQGSIFDNYLFFGEQPYNYSTPSINKENFFGNTRVASYGTFRHPNVFGGFLSIVLIWFLANIRKSRLFLIAFTLGCIALLFTLSKTAWLAFSIGILAYFLFKKGKFRLILLFVALIVAIGLLLPFFTSTFQLKNISLTSRADLLTASYQMLLAKPLFGYGYNASTPVIQAYLSSGHVFKFSQPVHNIFILLIVETGFIGLVLFILFLWQKLSIAKNSFLLIFISLLQIIVLGSFDHYIFTMHQMQLLFWLLISLV